MKDQIIIITNKIESLNRNKDFIEDFIGKLKGNTMNFAMDELDQLNKQLIVVNRTCTGYILKELNRVLPGNLGKLFFVFYGQFLDEPLDSDEKVKSWEELVRDLDAMEEIEYPNDIKEIINDYYGNTPWLIFIVVSMPFSPSGGGLLFFCTTNLILFHFFF